MTKGSFLTGKTSESVLQHNLQNLPVRLFHPFLSDNLHSDSDPRIHNDRTGSRRSDNLRFQLTGLLDQPFLQQRIQMLSKRQKAYNFLPAMIPFSFRSRYRSPTCFRFIYCERR